MSKSGRCVPTKQQYCTQMNNYVQGCNENKKGLVPIETTRFSDLETTFVGIAYKDRSNARGVFINFCPWCGVDYQPQLEEAEKKWKT